MLEYPFSMLQKDFISLRKYINGSDEISLDDFFDDDSFGSDNSEKEDDVPNDEPIDMDISFNENEDEIPTEDIKDDDELGLDDIDNNSISTDSTDDMFTTETTEQISNNSEEVSLDDFSSSEDVDLSDFGIDSDAEETPVTSNVSESTRNTVVDYDLAISDDDSVSEVPMINEVHSSSNQASDKYHVAKQHSQELQLL